MGMRWMQNKGRVAVHAIVRTRMSELAEMYTSNPGMFIEVSKTIIDPVFLAPNGELGIFPVGPVMPER